MAESKERVLFLGIKSHVKGAALLVVVVVVVATFDREETKTLGLSQRTATDMGGKGK